MRLHGAEQRVVLRGRATILTGIHCCVGDRLAETQLRIHVHEMMKRRMKIELMGEPVRLYSNFIRGIRSLPVRTDG
jgi:cytochrome P450